MSAATAGNGRGPVDRAALERAVVETVAYGDIFDFPLTEEEIHRYLIGIACDREALAGVLSSGRLVARCLSRYGCYFTLAGRERIVETRRRRAGMARRMWPVARRYGAIIAALPLVRMVAVTGALAVDNVDPGADIDYLIVTRTDRLWLCRALVIAVVRFSARQGHIICPNYFISERALAIPERSLFAARELAQMVPLAGNRVYTRLLDENPWTARYLPNAAAYQAVAPDTTRRSTLPLRAVTEGLLGVSPLGRLDRWEMRRKIRKFERLYGDHVEAEFAPDWCKGHFDGHAGRIMDELERRLDALAPEFAGERER